MSPQTTHPDTQQEVDRIRRFDSMLIKSLAWAGVVICGLTVVMAIVAVTT